MKKLEIQELVLLFLISITMFFALEIGNINKEVLPTIYIYLNTGTIFFLLAACHYCFRHWMSLFIPVSLLYIIAVVNYYVIQYRGIPFTFGDIANVLTAANVISNYSFFITKQIVIISLCFVVSAICVFRIWMLNKEKSVDKKRQCIQIVSIVVCGALFAYTGYVSNDSIKPKQTLSWSWQESYYQYGYLATTLEVFQQSFDPVMMPASYDEELLTTVKGEEQQLINTPDIILILNESYFDLQQVLDISVDKDYMKNYKGLQNAVRGYTVVPYSGGGTNNSEYELLTSNSLQLAPGITPFNVLNLKDSNNIVSFLKNCGYSSIGAHSEPALNYSRGKAYIDLGFDKTYFDGDFYNLAFYKNRWFETDECLYENAIKMYETLPTEKPRMLYLLTIQNHGGWDMNAPEDDIIHIEEDYGEYTEQINEYLSCLYLSDLALQKLIDYYENIDRPVVICMLGDHSPAFVNELVDTSNENINLKMHSTPFLIWANYPIEEKNLGYIGINAIVPNLLNIAGIPLSPYYQYILDMQEQVPVLTSRGVYYDKNGLSYGYDEKTQYTDLVNQYFNMEYNNIGKHADRKQSLFEP